MPNLNLLKQEFLKRWIEGLRECNNSSKEMGLFERKNAIKVTANIAMALARKGKTNSWSQAVITNHNGLIRAHQSNNIKSHKMRLRKRRQWLKRKTNEYLSRRNVQVIAKRIVRKRTQVLKRLVPGGDRCGDEVSLMREALDYVISLRAQVDVMRSFLAISDHK